MTNRIVASLEKERERLQKKIDKLDISRVALISEQKNINDAIIKFGGANV